ncbi:HNH endonuclease signature motif containing protein [Lacisediminihabitans changchengi]|uniref:DUF222 domain-containing protein n=1 Tax=Lacisediminihabitans changchengi TaxID=2787634 RepID=A0A934SII0_9MICO|nr:HNH endonuclease signature motif containing protein [Lacisediminihabitans changchengi]MBK4346014.1 DUF222 domain-containing protein [Lacisediminihabitans changchengi]
MNLSARTLLAHVTAFAEAWGEVDIDALSSERFLALTADLGRVARVVATAQTAVAGQLVQRSATHLGAEGLARSAGHSTPALFLAELWQIGPADAGRLCVVGEATRSPRALDGSPLPARYPAVSEGLSQLAISVEAASVIVRELDHATPFCTADARLAGERVLVDHAPGLTVKQVAGIARHVRDHLDQEGAQPRDLIRRQRRSLTMVEQDDGMMRFVWVMPPETAGLVRAGIDHLVAEQLRQKRDRDRVGLAIDGMGDLDDRTIPQRRADAAEDMFRRAIDCSCGGAKAPLVTMVVRLALDQLVTGLGAAQIDGIDAGISGTRARILAADANLIPMVLGGRGEVLDVGRDQRLFTPAQRHALAERYGGCAFPACGHPPSYTEAHHIRWWSNGGPTDLGNGIPLCSFHHHRVHDDGWEIQLRDQVPYFIPPPWIDPDREPRRGGKVQLLA